MALSCNYAFLCPPAMYAPIAGAQASGHLNAAQANGRASLGRMPNELIEEIASHLMEPEPDVPSLWSMALVSKRIHRLVMPFLYEKVTVTLSSNGSGVVKGNCSALLNTFLRNFHHAHYVKTFSAIRVIDPMEDVTSSLRQNIVEITARNDAIYAVTNAANFLCDSSLTAIARLMPKVEYLDLARYIWSFMLWGPSLYFLANHLATYFPNLRKLRLSLLPIHNMNDLIGLFSHPKLQHLEIDGGSFQMDSEQRAWWMQHKSKLTFVGLSNFRFFGFGALGIYSTHIGIWAKTLVALKVLRISIDQDTYPALSTGVPTVNVLDIIGRILFGKEPFEYLHLPMDRNGTPWNFIVAKPGVAVKKILGKCRAMITIQLNGAVHFHKALTALQLPNLGGEEVDLIKLQDCVAMAATAIKYFDQASSLNICADFDFAQDDLEKVEEACKRELLTFTYHCKTDKPNSG